MEHHKTNSMLNWPRNSTNLRHEYIPIYHIAHAHLSKDLDLSHSQTPLSNQAWQMIWSRFLGTGYRILRVSMKMWSLTSISVPLLAMVTSSQIIVSYLHRAVHERHPILGQYAETSQGLLNFWFAEGEMAVD